MGAGPVGEFIEDERTSRLARATCENDPKWKSRRLAPTVNHGFANETATAFDAALLCSAIFVNVPASL
jgi:hypothetical protein